MIRFLLLSILIFTTTAFGKGKWQTHYNIVNKDIKSVEALRSSDLNLRIRLFELYGEKLSLLLEKETKYRIKYLQTGNNKPLLKVQAEEAAALRKIERLGAKIERQTKRKDIIAKINYFKSLNFYGVKKYKQFYKFIKKAEKYNKDKNLGYMIDTKLADHYFNEKKYKKARVYYKRLIHKKSDLWISKHYYNYAWCELKLNNFNNAIVQLKNAHIFDRRKGYYKIGEQLPDALLLFHAFAKRTKEGLVYFDKHKMSNFDNLLKYLHYVFENGNKKHAKMVIARLSSLKLTPDQQYQLMAKEVLVLRTIREFTNLQKRMARFKKLVGKKPKKVDEKHKAELISQISSYTGYLQELIKSKGLINKKTKKAYISYMAYNFGVLSHIDRKNALKYEFYEAESYFAIKSYGAAAKVYANSIRAQKKSKRPNLKYLDKSFDGLFKSLEKRKKPDPKLIEFSYVSYIHFYPRTKKSRRIYQRSSNFYMKRNQESKLFNTLSKYKKNYPKDINIQRDYYKKVLNKYIDKKDVNSLGRLKRKIDKRFLGFGKTESLKLSQIINQIHFDKYEKLAKTGNVDGALAGFSKLFSDKKSNYSLKVNALKRRMALENKKSRYSELASSVQIATKFYKLNTLKQEKNELLFYTQNICVADKQQDCFAVVDKIGKRKGINVPRELNEYIFKLKVSEAKNLLTYYKQANSAERKAFLFRNLVLTSPNFSDPLFNKFYGNKKYKIIIDNEVEYKFWRNFYSTLSFKSSEEYVQKLKLNSLKIRFLKIAANQKKIIPKIKFVTLPKKRELSFEQFSKFAQGLVNSIEQTVNGVNKQMGKVNPNYMPYYLSKAIKSFRAESSKIRKFIPVSKDKNLEKAMTSEMDNFVKALDQKLFDFERQYFQSINNALDGIGAKKYSKDVLSSPINQNSKEVYLWLE